MQKATPKEVRAVFVDGLPYQKHPDGTLTPLKGKTDWKRLDAMTDAQIEAAAKADPDAQPFTDEEWARAEIVKPHKIQVAMRLDNDVVAYFKSRGAGYQTRINAVLREYMRAHRRKAG